MVRERSLAHRNTKETQIPDEAESGRNRSYQILLPVSDFLITCWRDFTRHGLFDLQLRVQGDLQVDDHHTIEDTGIVLGSVPSGKQWETKKGSAGMAAVSFPWMKHWCFVQ